MLDKDIKYTVVRSRRRSVAIKVDPDANLTVRVPLRMSDRAIAEFVASKQDWIQKHPYYVMVTNLKIDFFWKERINRYFFSQVRS